MQADRLLALTFAVEDAVARRNWAEVNALFDERGRLLNSLSGLDPERAQAILEADARLHQRLAAERLDLQGKLKRSRQASAARKLYAKFR